ncbi:MAG: hypothetical protein Q9186_003782 [Xanthomendoza sp. 1 TL-2023]
MEGGDEVTMAEKDHQADSISSSRQVQSSSRLLSLPPELRIMIYRNLLVSPWWIENAHQQLGPGRVEKNAKAENINTNILSTCRSVYQEAVPILWKNVFTFRHWYDIKSFGHDQLPHPYGFPALQELRLGFCEVQFKSERGYSAWVPWGIWSIFARDGGIERLAVKGLRHEGNLKILQRLVSEGGRFTVMGSAEQW